MVRQPDNCPIFTLVLVRTERRHAELTEIVQRAYLWVDIGYIRARTGEDGFVPRIVIRNTGHLPAKNVSWIFCESHFSSDNEWKPVSDPGEPKGDITLAPGAEMTHGGGFLLIPKDQPAKTAYLYVWGYVRYHDGFEAGRITQFCHRYNMSMIIRRAERRGLRAFPKKACRIGRYYNDAT